MSQQLETVFGSSCSMHHNKGRNMQASGHMSVSDHTKHYSEILVQELPSLAPPTLYAHKALFWLFQNQKIADA